EGHAAGSGESLQPCQAQAAGVWRDGSRLRQPRLQRLGTAARRPSARGRSPVRVGPARHRSHDGEATHDGEQTTMSAIWIRDSGAFCVQVASLVLAGAAVAVVCRLRQPRAMLVYWQVLLFACLALPFCQPWHVSSAPTGSDLPLVSETTVL